jgi:hypothetical protein
MQPERSKEALVCPLLALAEGTLKQGISIWGYGKLIFRAFSQAGSSGQRFLLHI